MFQQKNCCTHAFSRDAAGFDKTETIGGLKNGHKMGYKLQNDAPVSHTSILLQKNLHKTCTSIGLYQYMSIGGLFVN